MHQRTERHDIKGLVTKAKHKMLCQNNKECQWKRRHSSTTRNKNIL